MQWIHLAQCRLQRQALVNDTRVLHQLSHYDLIKKDSAAWNYFSSSSAMCRYKSSS
jgi:hypothetical protein